MTFAGNEVKPQLIDEVSTSETPRVKTQYEEFNRVLGGGVVPGSLVLIGGDPGIGKSTLLLQVSGQLAQTQKVLYVSGEESAVQIKLRANRLGVGGSNFYLYPETNMDRIRQNIEELKPDYVIIDSVQTMQEPEMTSAVGSVAQIREVTSDLMKIAKTNGVTAQLLVRKFWNTWLTRCFTLKATSTGLTGFYGQSKTGLVRQTKLEFLK